MRNEPSRRAPGPPQGPPPPLSIPTTTPGGTIPGRPETAAAPGSTGAAPAPPDSPDPTHGSPPASRPAAPGAAPWRPPPGNGPAERRSRCRGRSWFVKVRLLPPPHPAQPPRLPAEQQQQRGHGQRGRQEAGGEQRPGPSRVPQRRGSCRGEKGARMRWRRGCGAAVAPGPAAGLTALRRPRAAVGPAAQRGAPPAAVGRLPARVAVAAPLVGAHLGRGDSPRPAVSRGAPPAARARSNPAGKPRRGGQHGARQSPERGRPPLLHPSASLPPLQTSQFSLSVNRTCPPHLGVGFRSSTLKWFYSRYRLTGPGFQ